MRHQPYPNYKPSGVEWLGEVPWHWELGKVSGLFRFRSGGTPSTDVADYWDGHIPWVSAKDMKSLRIVDAEDHITSRAVAESATSLVPAGTVLLVARSGILKHTLPVAVAEREVAINQDIKGLLPATRPIDSHFFVYWVHGNQAPLLMLWRQQGATVESLDMDTVKVASLPLPPLAEQHAIADFLDRETAKLDTLEAKNRTLIDRLKEKRTALISRTVTRGLPPDAASKAGLDPHPRLKPSGVEWIGEVPEHWDIGKFSREVRIAEGQVDPGMGPYCSMILVAPNHIESGTGRLRAQETAADQGAISGKYFCCSGEVIYSKIRPVLAKAVLATADCLCSADMYPMTPRSRLRSRYLLLLLISCQFTAWSVLEADRVAMPKLNRETLSALRLPVPLVSEQQAIADFLDRETSKIDALVAKVEIIIERLQEYRAALITAAVTGKIDVREAVA